MIVSTPLAVFFALTALLSLGELAWQWRRGSPDIVSYIADREALFTHVAMNGGMALMFAPFYGEALAAGLQGVYMLAGGVLVIRLLWLRGRRAPGRAAGTIYHLVGLAAMIWAIHVMADAMATGMPGMAGSGMAGMDMAGMGAPPQRSWIAVVLAALFVLDGLATAALAAFAPDMMVRMAQLTAGAPQEGAAPAATIRLVRLAAFPHVVMDAGMALMLWPLAFP